MASALLRTVLASGFDELSHRRFDSGGLLHFPWITSLSYFTCNPRRGCRAIKRLRLYTERARVCTSSCKPYRP